MFEEQNLPAFTTLNFYPIVPIFFFSPLKEYSENTMFFIEFMYDLWF